MAHSIPFDTLPDGTVIEQYTLSAGALSCDILTYGGTLRALRVPDRDGKTVDVLLGFDKVEPYRSGGKYLGALIGRYANRIGAARFSLNGTPYPLTANDHAVNHLHGGGQGFNARVWKVESASEDKLVLSLFSPDGEEGYPGDLLVEVTYTLTEKGLSIGYQAKALQDTVCNLTNHAYFNLSGHDSGQVADQTIQILADRYTPTDAASIPLGMNDPVEGTPMDLRQPTAIGARIDDDFAQLAMAGGYDHNWAVSGWDGALRPIARAYSPATGIALEVQTTLPGVQFYTGNYLDGTLTGKGGAVYPRRGGFCLETQFFPDSPNHENFPSCVIPGGTTFTSFTGFYFSVK